MLQIAKRIHSYYRVMVQSHPGSALVMVRAKFVLELLLQLFASPAGLNCACQRPASGVSRVVGKLILAFATGARFAYQSSDMVRKMLPK